MSHPIKAFFAAFTIILVINFLAQLLSLFYSVYFFSHIPYAEFSYRLSHPTVLAYVISWISRILYLLAYFLAGFIVVRIEKRKLWRHGLGFGLLLVIIFNIVMVVGTLLTIHNRIPHDRLNTAVYQKQEHNIISAYYPIRFNELTYLAFHVVLTMAGITLAERKLLQKKLRTKVK